MTVQSKRATEARRGRGVSAIVGIALFCALTAFVLAGCGDSSDGTSTSAQGSGETGGAEESVSLAMVQTVPFIPYDKWVKAGAEVAARDGNAELTVQGPSVANGTNEATMAASLLANEPDGFAPNPCVLPAWERVMKEMSEQIANENVVAWDCPPISEAGQKSNVPTFVGVSTKKLGYEIVELIAKEAKLGKDSTGVVLLGNCSKGVPPLDERIEGAEEAAAENLPNAEVVEIGTALEQAANQAAWASALANQDDVIAAYGVCDQDQESLQSITTKNGGAFAAGGVNLNETQLKAIDAGTFTAGLSTQPWAIGYVTVHLLAEGARGTKAPEGFIDVGTREVTKENALEYSEALQSPAAEEKFYKPISEEILAEAEAGSNVKSMDVLFE